MNGSLTGSKKNLAFERRRRLEGGMRALAEGRAAEAERVFRELLQGDSQDPEALHGLACVARGASRPGVAIGLAGRALGQAGVSEAQKGRFHLTLGLALLEEGHVEPARAALRVSTVQQPSDPRAFGALAEVLMRQGRLEEACAALDRAVALAAADVGYRAMRAGVLGEVGQHREALADFRAVAEALPEDAAAQANLGAAYFAVNDPVRAVEVLQRAVALGPPSVETLNNLGLAEMALGDLVASAAALEAAFKGGMGDGRVANNLGTVVLELGERDRAVRLFREAASSAVDLVERARAAFNLGTVLLGRGLFREGWGLFENRLALLRREERAPEWDGVVGAGRIRIRAEQGLGDVVQFLRFLPEAAARVPLLVEVPEHVRPLLAMMPGLAGLPEGRVVTEACEAVVASCSLLSLPAVLECEEMLHAPYLSCPGLKRERGLRVGVCWRGSEDYRFDRRRSVSFGMLGPVLDCPGVSFVSLQFGDGESGLERPALETLGDTARAIAGCDLVISVDTVVAHLAGALGCPVWLLNRFGGDWRWWGARREGGPGAGVEWYGSLTQFQVSRPGLPEQVWPEVMERVAVALRGWRQAAS